MMYVHVAISSYIIIFAIYGGHNIGRNMSRECFDHFQALLDTALLSVLDVTDL